MLEELTIQNYALIDRLRIDFAAGLNVLTGETGAGKSILAGALGLLHGAKADTSAIRTGSEESMVSGVFRVGASGPVIDWLAARDIEPEDETVIVRRTVKRAGRGSIYIQSTPVTRADLSEFSDALFDMHGQHEHQTLLSEDNHRAYLDGYAGLTEEVASFRRLFSELSTLKRKHAKLLASERERLRESDILSFAVKEIEDAGLKAGEEEELDAERRLLSQHEKLFSLLEDGYGSLAENRSGALMQLRAARQALDGAAAIDPTLSATAKRLEDAFFEIEDIAEVLSDYRSRVQFTPERLEQVEDRLAAIHRLEKKYGSSIDEVLSYLAEAREQLDSLENWEEDKARLEGEIKELEQRVRTEAARISSSRSDTAGILQEKIVAILQTLGMPKVRFEVAVEPRMSDKGVPVCGAYGMDDVAFRISANPGEPLKPLKAVASGGEISRVMLAIKTALAETDEIDSLVFDEIDSGVGGEVAVAIGEHLYSLGRHKQVLAITHLATIAVRADNHIRVEKRVRGEQTTTEIELVKGDERVEEIARMLAGDRKGQTSRTHAEEMLRKYRKDFARE